MYTSLRTLQAKLPSVLILISMEVMPVMTQISQSHFDVILIAVYTGTARSPEMMLYLLSLRATRTLIARKWRTRMYKTFSNIFFDPTFSSVIWATYKLRRSWDS